MNHVVGIGTDICDCHRIAEMIERHGDIFLQKVFTAAEIAYCQPQRASVQHFAGRWAAKEAVLKALGTGWAKGVGWTDLEVWHEPGGQPRLRLRGAAAELAARRGISEILISISHTETVATAIAVATGSPVPADRGGGAADGEPAGGPGP